MPVNQPAQYQSFATATPEWKTAIINVISYACPFRAISCQKVYRETGL